MRAMSLVLLIVAAVGCDSSYSVAPPAGQTPGVVDARGVTSWSPSTIRVRVGDTVTFRNASLTVHNVRFAVDVAGHPDDILDFASATRPVTFTTAGTFPYQCGIHPVMQGQVVVQP